jgi:hypothetical protein
VVRQEEGGLMKPATPHAALRIKQARKAGRSLWVQDTKTGAIVGYLTPCGALVRIANAGVLYQRGLNDAAGEAFQDE